MAQFPKVVAHFETQLVNKIDSSSSTMELSSVSTPAGNLGAGTYGFVIEEESASRREYVIGTLSGSTLTFTHRDLSPTDATTTDASGDTDRQSHRKGASVKLTNFPILLLIQRVLEGTDQLDADAPLEYDATASITGNNMLATKAYVDAVVNGGTVTFDNQIFTGDAGETVAAGELVYCNESDGEWYLVDATDTSTFENVRVGIAQGAGTDGNPISGGVLVEGLDNNISYTAGQLYYATDTAGALGTSAGTNSFVVGVGDANNKLVFLPYYSVTTREKAALAGGGDFGTPSGTNKFLTESWASGDGSSEVVVFTASGTWTKDAGLKRIRVQAWGGGGSGGKDTTQESGGGGGGGYAEAWIEAADLGATETVTIGAGGAAISASQAQGNAGGNTTFGSLLTAYGGGGGAQGASGAGGGGGGGMFAAGSTPTTSSAGVGGNGGAGQLFAGDGGDGVGSGAGENSYFGGGGGGGTDGTTADDGGDSVWGGAGGGAAETPNAGAGGTSKFGGNGGAGVSHASNNATDGSQPGGGGGAKYGASGNSGAGGDGQVIVTEYYV